MTSTSAIIRIGRKLHFMLDAADTKIRVEGRSTRSRSRRCRRKCKRYWSCSICCWSCCCHGSIENGADGGGSTGTGSGRSRRGRGGTCSSSPGCNSSRPMRLCRCTKDRCSRSSISRGWCIGLGYTMGLGGLQRHDSLMCCYRYPSSTLARPGRRRLPIRRSGLRLPRRSKGKFSEGIYS